MLHYPDINPVLLHITDTIQIRWYGVMYILAFILSFMLCKTRLKLFPSFLAQADLLSVKDPKNPTSATQLLFDYFFYIILGVVLGGRIGYMLFYALPNWLAEPMQLFRIWQGGMSFHGGLLGVLFASFIFAKRNNLSLLLVGDLLAPTVPLGLGLGRIGNFINGELWGKVTDVPWGMVFPHAGPMPRHPSQLYAVMLEGILLFVLVWSYAKKPRGLGKVTGLFIFGYGFIRFFEEFFRQPDPQYGYLAFGWLTMGQVLCVPMILIGCWLMARQSKYDTALGVI